MSLSFPLIRCSPNNFTSLERTPWAGTAITQIKGPLLSALKLTYPDLVGESWEVSTDSTFPSHTPKGFLSESLKQAPPGAWGLWEPYARKGHLPLLLKWLEAKEPLSVQVHPPLTARLSPPNCGKHESWLVLQAKPEGYVYLGFQKGVKAKDVDHALTQGDIESLLYKFCPQPYDYISVPPGCIHAVGPGVLVAEPQTLWPGRQGVTYRLFDWKRTYNAKGILDTSSQGKPRALHIKESLETLNWSLPCGEDIMDAFVHPMGSSVPFKATPYNGFPCVVFSEPGLFTYKPLVANSPTLFTVWSGSLEVDTPQGWEQVSCGESGILPVVDESLAIRLLGESPRVGFFSLDPKLLANHV